MGDLLVMRVGESLAVQRRRLIIDMARRRQKPGTGSSSEFLQERTVHTRFPHLNSPLAGIPWAAVGAAATRLYMPERVTNDLDVLIRRDDLRIVVKRLRDSGYTFKGRPSIGGSSWVAPCGSPVDVLAIDEPWVVGALEEAQANRDAAGIPILPLPYLVLMKLRASRAVDFGDLARMLGLALESEREAVRSVFRRLAPEDAEDLESLIALGKLEFETAEIHDDNSG